MSEEKIKPGHDNTVFRVLEKRCDQCLFSQNAIVRPGRREQVLADCQETSTYFICHKASLAGVDACCRGFYDAFPRATLAMCLAEF